MFEPPPPPDTYQPPQAPYVMHKPLSPEERIAAEQRAITASKAREAGEAAREPSELARFLEAAHQRNTIRAFLDKDSGNLYVWTLNSAGKMSSQPLMIGQVWDALAERGIHIQPKASEVVRFRIGEEIEVAATVELNGGFIGRLFGYHTILLPSFQVRWLSLEERVADWDASLASASGNFHIIYSDRNHKEIHEDKFNVYDMLAKSGISLQPKGSAVVRFALGADLMEATVELEVGFLGFNRKLKLLSVKRKRGEAWRLGTLEGEMP